LARDRKNNWDVEVESVVVAADGGVLVVFGEEVAVESGGLDGVVVAWGGLIDAAASMMTILVEVAVRPFWSVATY
jgi:hypothetical protein